jgi:hypothetical protein
MMSLAGEGDEGRAGELVQAYWIHGLQVFQGFPRAAVGHGKTLTGHGKADQGLCSCVSYGVCIEGAAGQTGRIGRMGRRDQAQPQSWHELAGAGSREHGTALRGHAPSVFSHVSP